MDRMKDASNPTGAFRGFEEFWPFYLREHGRPGTRRLHFVGTLLALLSLVAAIALRRPLLLLAAPLFGYGLAWAGHFAVERNRPASFKHPLWSARGDFRMFVLMLSGRIDRELRRLDI